jgi:LPXTG-site transpeptidase (sortase) family protein
LIVVVAYIALNLNTLHQTISFWYNNEYKAAPIDISTQQLAVISTNTNSPVLPEINDNSLFIPVINVKAPISWAVPNNPTDVSAGLSRGLIHIKSTALPGEIGNVFITGHSSNYPWAKGNYNNIFALLNKTVVGDMVQIKYKNVDYVYKVTEIKVVEPTDISVLKSKNESVLTLMTCTPVGTSLRRLIVIANQIYPNPYTNQPMGSSNTDSSLPPIH